ncbi:MAG TPA: hypothetical protein VKV96_11405, partial [Roseiarcus sp.]|nr:hypothetical protein [Roseiarcus sp.]
MRGNDNADRRKKAASADRRAIERYRSSFSFPWQRLWRPPILERINETSPGEFGDHLVGERLG